MSTAIPTPSAAAAAPILTGSPAALPQATEDRPYLLRASDLLAGWSAPDGATLSVIDLAVDRGTLVDNGNGTWTFTPVGNDNGTLGVRYGVSDGQTTLPATTTLTIRPVNDDPMRSGAPALLTLLATETPEGSYRVSAADLLVGWRDIDGDPPEALCEKLTLLLGNPDLRSTMGLRAVTHARDYAWERIAAQIVDVYQGLMK